MPSDRVREVEARLLQDPLVPYRVLEQEFGISRQRVQQIAAGLGIQRRFPRTPEQDATPATPKRKGRKPEPPLELVCAACGKPYQLSGSRLASFKNNRKLRPDMRPTCPDCFSVRVYSGDRRTAS